MTKNKYKTWPTKKLGEVCEIEYGTRVVRFRNESGQYYVYGGGGKTFTTKNYNRENRVIISRFGMSPNCVRKVAGKFFLNDSGLTLSPKNKEELTKNYLDFFLFSIEDKIFNLGRGQAQRNLNMDEFKNLEIPLPPIAEQKKIVARLESVLGKIKQAKRLREEAESAAEALLPAELHKIFEGGKKKGWEEKELGEISTVVTGNTPKTSISSYYGDKYLWARPGDLNEAYVGSTEKMLSKEGFENGGVRKIPAGAVMMCCIGSIGKIGIALQEMATNQQINSFVPYVARIDGKFLFYSLLHSREKFVSGASSTTLQIINKSRCEAIKIPLPPLAEQKKIVEHLDALNEKIKKLREYQRGTKSNMESLERSVLHQVFAGK